MAAFVNGGGDYALQNGGISGTNASLTKSGGGTLTVSTVNTYTGATVIDGGTLKLAAPATSLAGVPGLTMRVDATNVTGSGNPAAGAAVTTWTRHLAGSVVSPGAGHAVQSDGVHDERPAGRPLQRQQPHQHAGHVQLAPHHHVRGPHDRGAEPATRGQFHRQLAARLPWRHPGRRLLQRVGQ
ncbi:MAG: autotransporter-associated beta strand repeat-containing protein [Kiritimatiellia bacterium]